MKMKRRNKLLKSELFRTSLSFAFSCYTGRCGQRHLGGRTSNFVSSQTSSTPPPVQISPTHLRTDRLFKTTKQTQKLKHPSPNVAYPLRAHHHVRNRLRRRFPLRRQSPQSLHPNRVRRSYLVPSTNSLTVKQMQPRRDVDPRPQPRPLRKPRLPRRLLHLRPRPPRLRPPPSPRPPPRLPRLRVIRKATRRGRSQARGLQGKGR